MSSYFAEDNWSIEIINGTYYFCFIDPGLTGENVRLPVTREELEYAVRENPTFDNMMCLLKVKNLI